MLMIASCFGAANAQLMVDATGKTGVGIETYDTLYSQLAVNGRGENGVTVYMNTSKPTGLKIKHSSTASSNYGLYIENTPSGLESYGVYGRSATTSSAKKVQD